MSKYARGEVKYRLATLNNEVGEMALTYIHEIEQINSTTLAQLNYDNGELIIKNEKLRKENEELKDAAKVNEWCKQEIDDIFGLISKDWSIRHFICIMKDKSCVTATGNCDESCNGEVSVNLTFDHDDEKYCVDDVMWWKEIILPKENR